MNVRYTIVEKVLGSLDTPTSVNVMPSGRQLVIHAIVCSPCTVMVHGVVLVRMRLRIRVPSLVVDIRML